MTSTDKKPLFGPEQLANPYPLYHWLRSQGPVWWSEELDGWLVSGFDEIAAIVRDLRLSVRSKIEIPLKKVHNPIVREMMQKIAPNMWNSDPPAHNRMRALVSKAFTPRAVEAMAPRIQAAVDRLLDKVEPQGRMDVIADLSHPLPVLVITEMLGVPLEQRDRFKAWSEALSVLANWVGDLTLTQMLEIGKAVMEFRTYTGTLIEQRRKQPQNDLITALVQAEEAGDRLSEGELYSNVFLLNVAGHETTTNLIGNAVLALLRHPNQMQKLRDDPSLLDNAVEELLRYDSSVQMTTRQALEDVQLAGQTIRKGQTIYILWGAANHDPKHFPNPEKLDVTRANVNHMAFGAGTHYCLGASLARLEIRISIGTLLRRFPKLQLATDQLEYHANFDLHGLKSLPVTF